MEEIKKEIYEQDAIEEKMEEDYKLEMQIKWYVKCKVCEMWCEDTTNGICENCIDGILETMTIDDTIEYAENNEDEFILFTQYLFNESQVIEILKDHIKTCKEEMLKKGKIEYLENDIYHLLDYLEDRGEI